MTPGILTREEFRDTMADLKADLKGDLVEIRDHLKTLNGRVGKGEVESENHRTRLVGLEKEVFAHPRRRRQDHAGEGEEWATAFTKREYALMSLGFGIIYVLLKVVEFLGERTWHVLTAGKA